MVSPELERLLNRLPTEERAKAMEVLSQMDSALEHATNRLKVELENAEQAMQASIQAHEQAQATLSDAELEHRVRGAAKESAVQRCADAEAKMPGAQGADLPALQNELALAQQEVKETAAALGEAAESESDARYKCESASAAMEARLAKRTEMATALTQAKDVGEQQQRNTVKTILEQLKPSTNPSDGVDLVIRIGGSLDELGIKVGEFGTIKDAPSGLFDKDYSVVAIDGKRFHHSMRSLGGEKDVILRCKNEKIVLSMSRVPSKLTKGMALKLLQVMLEPDKNGFGIDLTDFNTVASVVAGGAAAKSELQKGDIIVSVDGVNLGGKKLIQVMERGHSSYCFGVVRPAPPGPSDQIAEEEQAPAAADAASEKAPEAAQSVVETAKDASAEALKESVNNSLTQVQQQAEQLADAERLGAPRILRVEPANGTGVTVEWMPIPADAPVRYYQLEWKLHTDTRWTHTDASSHLETTLVTKGSLRPNGGYQFRVRACDNSGVWGPFTEPLDPVRPDGGAMFRNAPKPDVDALSTISEEFSTTVSKATTQQNGAGNVNMEMLQAVLVDQRQAMEEQYKIEQRKLEAVHEQQLKMKELEGEEWRSKFLDAAGTRMQAVLDAKEEVRSEAETKLRADMEAASKAKLDALEAVRRAREAEDIAAACQAEVDKYKERYETAWRDARAEVETEARASVEFVMKKAAQEIKDKVKVAEMQADARVQRAVAETKKACEEAAAAELRRAVREMEAKHLAQLQAVQGQAGAGLANRMARMQEKHDLHVQHAVKEAVAAESEAAEKRLVAAVSAAKEQAIAETEGRLSETQAKLEKHVLTVTSRVESKVSEERRDEVARAVAEERARGEAAQKQAVLSAVTKVEQKMRLQMEQMTEGLQGKIRDAVAQRERELLDADGRVRELSVGHELREQLQSYRAAASEAARKWGSGNDDFEEAALNKTSAALALAQQGAEAAGRRHVMLDDDEFDTRTVAPGGDDGSDAAGEAEQRRERRRRRKEDDAKGGDKDEEARGRRDDKGKRDRKGSKPSATPSPAMEPLPEGTEALPEGMGERPEVQMLRERHQLELTALRSRHEAEETLMMDDDTTGTGADRRAAQLQQLRDRQLGEAIALGASLTASDVKAQTEALTKAQKHQRRKAELEADEQADTLSRGAKLAAKEEEVPGYTELVGATRKAKEQISGMHAAAQRGIPQMADDDDIALAVQGVRELEVKVEQMAQPQMELQASLETERRERQKMADKLREMEEKHSLEMEQLQEERERERRMSSLEREKLAHEREGQERETQSHRRATEDAMQSVRQQEAEKRDVVSREHQKTADDAAQSVRQLEAQLEQMAQPLGELQTALEIEKREHQRTTDKLRQLLSKKGVRVDEALKEKPNPLSASESRTLADALSLMQLFEKQASAMQAVLQDISQSGSGEARGVQKQLAKQQATRQLAAGKLEALMKRASKTDAVELSAAEAQELGAAMTNLEESGTAGEWGAKVEELHARAKRVRLERLQEARQALYDLKVGSAVAEVDASLAIPISPIAAAEDGFSMAIDWVPPVKGVASRYHLQWREQGAKEWSSSAASEKITVPCCTKGNLRTHAVYEFRVRAFGAMSDRWGPWSTPTHPASPSIRLQGAPSRPELSPLEGLVILAEWSPPLLGAKAKVVQYEVQWCVCGGSSKLAWSSEQQALTTECEFTTPPLKKGSTYYTFRARAMIKTYATSSWTEWSPPAAPCLPFLREPPPAASEVSAAPPMQIRYHGKDETESMIEAQLERAAEECPTEVRSTVQAEVQKLKERNAQDRAAMRQVAPAQPKDLEDGEAASEVGGKSGVSQSVVAQPAVSRGVDTLSTWD